MEDRSHGRVGEPVQATVERLVTDIYKDLGKLPNRYSLTWSWMECLLIKARLLLCNTYSVVSPTGNIQ